MPSQPDQVMPTALGNVLRNAELHPRDRYGIDAVLTWPRLYPLRRLRRAEDNKPGPHRIPRQRYLIHLLDTAQGGTPRGAVTDSE